MKANRQAAKPERRSLLWLQTEQGRLLVQELLDARWFPLNRSTVIVGGRPLSVKKFLVGVISSHGRACFEDWPATLS